VFSGRRRVCTGTALVSTWARSHSGVPSLDALSTTRISSSPGVAARRGISRWSSSSRLNVTTTAAIRRSVEVTHKP
jgi:hypothetical protein